VIIIVVIYILFKKLITSAFHKVYVSKDIIKYNLSENDKNVLKSISKKEMLVLHNMEDPFIFYTDIPWNATKNNNYIYCKKTDKYYIIDSPFYYYITSSVDDYDIKINNQVYIIRDFKKINVV
jgi:hypothetical protein